LSKSSLQWVHGLMTVVMAFAGVKALSHNLLQWVHGLMTVVMSACAQVKSRCTAWLQWVHGLMTVGMMIRASSSAAWPSWLQWVHGLMTVVMSVLDFIVMRGNEKLLVTVRPNLLAKHLKAIRELQNLFGSEYKPMRMWPSEDPDGCAETISKHESLEWRVFHLFYEVA
jgi:hypothetical protein